MKIAVTARGNDPQSRFEPHFGQANYLVVVDTESGDSRGFINRADGASALGDGIRTARRALELDAEAVITGHLGSRAFATLLAARIPAFLCDAETVDDAIRAFMDGELEPAREPDIT